MSGRILATALVTLGAFGCRAIIGLEAFPLATSDAGEPSTADGGHADARDARSDGPSPPCRSYRDAIKDDGPAAYFRFEGNYADEMSPRSFEVDHQSTAILAPSGGVGGGQFLDIGTAIDFAATMENIDLKGRRLTLEFWYRTAQVATAIGRLETEHWWMEVGQIGPDLQSLSAVVWSETFLGTTVQTGSPNGQGWHYATLAIGDPVPGGTDAAALYIHVGDIATPTTEPAPEPNPGQYVLHLGALTTLTPSPGVGTSISGGSIDEVAIYNDALDDVTIRKHIAAANCPP